MYQDFTFVTDPSTGPKRLAQLRSKLSELSLQGFVIPRADAHQGESVPERDERLAWLTGFSGSAGMAIALVEKAAVFVDGRYIVQVGEQVDSNSFELLQIPKNKATDWLSGNIREGDRIGYDPMLMTVNQVKEFSRVCEEKSASFVPVDENPIDSIWTDQPDPPLAPVTIQPLALAGESANEKVNRIKVEIAKQSAKSAILTLPDSIAWLFNIRGADVAHTPLPLSFAVVPADGKCILFIDGRKVSQEVRSELKDVLKFADPEGLLPEVRRRASDRESVLLDPDSAPELFFREIESAGGKVVEHRDPVILPKAVKNEAEINGMRISHIRDGVSYARFLAWFDCHAPSGNLDEITAAKTLEEFRANDGMLKDLSFDTISAAGPNGAIVHYRVNEKSNRRIEPGMLYLTDSGGQYPDGTTDITRTIAVGDVSGECRRRFTLVLKGNIAISTARFPEDTTGAQLDSLARIEMWRSGLDYDHGTGHGVGSYLSVHEGPQSISKLGNEPLVPGMILSNEPGFYKRGEYGIRIENLELVTGPEEIEGGERPMLGFETLTLAPIDRRLIDKGLLTDSELDWLNAYHSRVSRLISPELDSGTRAWLEKACAPI